MTGVKIETTDQIVAHTIVMIATRTIPVMTDIVMTDIMTSTATDIMTGVTTGDMMTRVRYWSSCRSPAYSSPNHCRSDDCHSDDQRDRCPWGDLGFRDRQDRSGSFDNQCDGDNYDDRHRRTPPPDSRDRSRGSPHCDRCSKSPAKPEQSQSCSPEHRGKKLRSSMLCTH